jgi:hypothetical protein
VEVLRAHDAVELLRVERHRLGLRDDTAEVGAMLDEASERSRLAVEDEDGVALLADRGGPRAGGAQDEYPLRFRANEPRHRGLGEERTGHDRMLTTRRPVRWDLGGGVVDSLGGGFSTASGSRDATRHLAHMVSVWSSR